MTRRRRWRCSDMLLAMRRRLSRLVRKGPSSVRTSSRRRRKPLTPPQRVVQMFEQMVEDKEQTRHDSREGQSREEAEEAGLSRAAGAAEEGQRSACRRLRRRAPAPGAPTSTSGPAAERRGRPCGGYAQSCKGIAGSAARRAGGAIKSILTGMGRASEGERRPRWRSAVGARQGAVRVRGGRVTWSRVQWCRRGKSGAVFIVAALFILSTPPSSLFLLGVLHEPVHPVLVALQGQRDVLLDQ